jgi:hypothetical protein
MHGGAPGSGAPPGNQNALTHGLYTRQALKERQELQVLLRESRHQTNEKSRIGKKIY